MTTTSDSSVSSQLTTDNFMQLFVTQLQYQNPLDPQDSSAFLSQLAQFTTLEQEQKQTDYLSGMYSMDAASLQVDQLSLANACIGKTVTYYPDATDTSSTASGVVESVKLEDDGTASFVIGGNTIPLANFLELASN